MSLLDVVPLLRFVRRLASTHTRPVVQPVPDVTPEDVERIVRRDFREEELPAATALLAGYKKGTHGSARLQVAALKLANGSLEKLRMNLELDYRDILVAAEYPN